MNSRTRLSAVTCGVAMLMHSAALGEYQGIYLRLHTTVPIDGVSRDVWRVYAAFSDPGDFLSVVAGSPTLGNFQLRTLNSSGHFGGGTFVNPIGGGATAPSFEVLGTQLEWDTFVDIGLAYVPEGGIDLTGLSPGFSGIGNVGVINSNNMGWFTAGPKPQGMAGNGLANINGSGNWGVLMMQLTVNAGNGFSGTVAVGGMNNNPLSGGTTFQTSADQTFTTHPPAPASVGLLIVGALTCASRRRR